MLASQSQHLEEASMREGVWHKPGNEQAAVTEAATQLMALAVHHSAQAP